MKKYTDLLNQAVVEISKFSKNGAIRKLTIDRGALLIPASKQINEINNFELVTWLIIK